MNFFWIDLPDGASVIAGFALPLVARPSLLDQAGMRRMLAPSCDSFSSMIS
jgi:hypothetical protein